MSLPNPRVFILSWLGLALFGCESPSDTAKNTAAPSPKAEAPSVPQTLSSQSLMVDPPPAPESQPDSLAPRYESSLADGIDFTRPGYPVWIKAVEGMSGYEPPFRWTEASHSKVAKFTFASELPARFILEISAASAFGPNAEKETVVRVGHDERRIRVLAAPGVFRLPFRNVKGIDAIEIIPPEPSSPAELDHNPTGDSRLLGVALVSIKVLPLDESDSKPTSSKSKKKH